MQRFILILSLSSLLMVSLCASAEQTYHTYSNSRFEYSISYPKELLFPQGEAENGDGQKFLSKEADASLLVYGSHNINAQTIKERYREESRGGTKVVSYRVLKDNWFVVSGYISGNIFYQKTILNNDQFKTFYFEYPETKKKTYDPVVKRLSSSFKG